MVALTCDHAPNPPQNMVNSLWCASQQHPGRARFREASSGRVSRDQEKRALLRATKKKLLIVAAVMLLSLSLSGCAAIARARSSYRMSSAEQSMFRRINTYRRAHGLPSLGTSVVANKKARFWAALMANGGCGRDASGVPRICHSNLAAGITVAWSRLGENVGMVSPRNNVAGMEGAFENSPPHAENMRSNVRYLGVGVAYWNNFMYVAEVFLAT
jgi:uncharacterized protein YkwD